LLMALWYAAYSSGVIFFIFSKNLTMSQIFILELIFVLFIPFLMPQTRRFAPNSFAECAKFNGFGQGLEGLEVFSEYLYLFNRTVTPPCTSVSAILLHCLSSFSLNLIWKKSNSIRSRRQVLRLRLKTPKPRTSHPASLSRFCFQITSIIQFVNCIISACTVIPTTYANSTNRELLRLLASLLDIWRGVL